LIFDTDILISLQRGHPGAARFVNFVAPEQRNLSVISYLELVYGSRDGGDLKKAMSMVADLFAAVVLINESISAKAVRIMEAFVPAHHLDASDALIAATALDRQEPLATGNQKHFRFIPGLELNIFRP
jgi:predicted nucleic acid-binding protein